MADSPAPETSAQKAVGHYTKDEWYLGEEANKLDDEVKAEDLRQKHIDFLTNPDANSLVDILGQDDVKSLYLDYTIHDSSALKWQKKDEWWVDLKIRAILFVTLIGALYLLPIPFYYSTQTDTFQSVYSYVNAHPALLATIKLLTIVGIAVQFFAMNWTKIWDTAKNWAMSRAQAETGRYSIVNTVLHYKDGIKTGAIPLLPLQLEYFRRFLMEDQLAYFKIKLTQNQKDYDTGQRKFTALKIIKYTVALIAVPVFLPTVFIQLQNVGILESSAMVKIFLGYYQPYAFVPKYADQSLLGLGVIVSAYHSHMMVKSREHMYERNIGIYGNMINFLEEQMATPLQQARKDAEAGEDKRVQAYIDGIKHTLNQEHASWLAVKDFNEIGRKNYTTPVPNPLEG